MRSASPSASSEDLAYGRNDEVGAGEPQPLLAAEMIGDGRDVRLRRAAISRVEVAS